MPSRVVPCSDFPNTSIQKFINLYGDSLQPPSFYHVRAYLLSCAAQDLCHPLCDWQYFQEKGLSFPSSQKKKPRTKVIQAGTVPGFLTQRMIYRQCVFLSGMKFNLLICSGCKVEGVDVKNMCSHACLYICTHTHTDHLRCSTTMYHTSLWWTWWLQLFFYNFNPTFSLVYSHLWTDRAEIFYGLP